MINLIRKSYSAHIAHAWLNNNTTVDFSHSSASLFGLVFENVLSFLLTRSLTVERLSLPLFRIVISSPRLMRKRTEWESARALQNLTIHFYWIIFFIIVIVANEERKKKKCCICDTWWRTVCLCDRIGTK